MCHYVVTCSGPGGEEDPLRHDPFVVAWIDDNRAAGGRIVIDGSMGFEDMDSFRTGRRTYRLRCAGCGVANVFWAEATVPQVLSEFAAVRDKLDILATRTLPPEYLRADYPNGDSINHSVTERVILPFRALAPMVKRLRTVKRP